MPTSTTDFELTSFPTGGSPEDLTVPSPFAEASTPKSLAAIGSVVCFLRLVCPRGALWGSGRTPRNNNVDLRAFKFFLRDCLPRLALAATQMVLEVGTPAPLLGATLGRPGEEWLDG